MSQGTDTYLLVAASLGGTGTFRDERLATFTERHYFSLPEPPVMTPTPSAGVAVAQPGLAGIVLELGCGIPSRGQFRLARAALRAGRRLFFFWPHEQAIECVDRERLRSFRLHWLAYNLYHRYVRFQDWRHRRRGPAAVPAAAGAGAQAGAAAAPPGAPESADALNHVSAEVASLRAHIAGGIKQFELDNSNIFGALASEVDIIRTTVDAFLPMASGSREMHQQVCQLVDAVARTRRVVTEGGTVLDNIRAYFEGGMPVFDRILAISEAAARTQSQAHAQAQTQVQVPNVGSTSQGHMELLNHLKAKVAPVPMPDLKTPPSIQTPLDGIGVYLRTDFWAPLISGGSYGHTCYQARAFARSTRDFLCILANRFPLLDDLGLRQVVVRPPATAGTEANLMAANEHYYAVLKPLLQAIRPAFLYERLCLGNYTGARLSLELGIPYIVEYNGSEISMKRSFAGSGYENEEMYLAAEDLAFRQATMISVISSHVRDDVVRRGIDPDKVLVNPNAVDLEAYAPASPAEYDGIRAELGFGPRDRVVGFIGTFGGWHGIEVLAEAMPRVCARAPDARFLLIGDGNFKPLVTEQVRRHRLEDRVVDVGRVNQQTGARLLRACDVLVSPHSAHMVDSAFFGSPTKMFEYMAVGGGIVASDLEQIGIVLSPGLRVAELPVDPASVGNRRALLCRPGDVEEFVDGVVALVQDRELCRRLGANARQAAETYYSWDQHVANVWLKLLGGELSGYARDFAAKGY
jgi:glycosyltransferase involved in cell wall biosynthesis